MALDESNHYVMRDEGSGEYLILDAGKPCPDYLPAHAQADMLTYELSIDGQWIVVDSGVYESLTVVRDYFVEAAQTCGGAADSRSVEQISRRSSRSPGRAFWQESRDGICYGRQDGYAVARPVSTAHPHLA